MTRSLAVTVFWIAAALCIVAELIILRAAFLPPADVSESSTVPHSPRGAEMLWAVIPAFGLAVLLASTWRAIH